MMHGWGAGLVPSAWPALGCSQLQTLVRARPHRPFLWWLSRAMPLPGLTQPWSSRRSRMTCGSASHCWKASWSSRSRQPSPLGPPSRRSSGSSRRRWTPWTTRPPGRWVSASALSSFLFHHIVVEGPNWATRDGGVNGSR
jgi:hypothetical protein